MKLDRTSGRVLAYCRIIGMICLLGLTTTTVIFFVIAYLSPFRMAIFDINHFHEANLELVLFGLAAPLMVYTFIEYIREERDLLQILK